MSGDINPTHVDANFAKSDIFHRVVAHGMWGGTLISTVLGTQLPGPGTIYVDQSLHFHRPEASVNNHLTVKVTKKVEETRRSHLRPPRSNQRGEEM